MENKLQNSGVLDKFRQARISRTRQQVMTRRRRQAVRLGEVLKEMMDRRIQPQQEDFSAVDKVWGELLPPQLLEHCRITGFCGGKLTVAADSPAYMYEMQLVSSELLKQLRRASVEKIRVILA